MLDHASDPTLLPLHQLVPDELNPRKEIDPEGIEALAASIRAVGLIQPLAGRIIQTEGGDLVGIVCGARRLAALQLLGDITRVPVVLAPDAATAEAWATADPVTHRPLHPADEVRAYGRMAKTHGVPEIAAAFGATETHVRRRLALASLPGAALDALKAGEITLSAAAVLTTAPSEEKALEVLGAGRGRGFEEHWWRRALHPAGIQPGDRRAVFVGVEEYRAEGGALTEDLFQDGAVLHDEKLLDKLFARKLTDTAEAIREAEGWGWVKALDTSWEGFDTTKVAVPPKKTALPEGDQERLDQLRRQGRLSAAEREELAALEARWVAGAFPEKSRKKQGIVIRVDHDGTLQRGATAWKDAKAAKAGADDEGAGSDDETTTVSNPNPTAEAALSQALRDELRAIHHATLQTALLGRPELLLDLLAWSVSGELSAWAQPIAVSLSSQAVPPEGEDGMHLDPRLAAPESRHATPSPETFAAFQARPEAERYAIIHAALARALGPLGGISAEATAFRHWLAEEVDARPRDHWTPTKANFFGRLRNAMLDSIWGALFAGEDEEKDAAWAKMKGKDKAAELDALFNSDDHREAWGMSRELRVKVDSWMPEMPA